MGYQFLQVVGLEKPSDLRRARSALLRDDPGFDCWVDPLDQVAWLHTPDANISDEQTDAAVERLKAAGFWADPIDQRAVAGPACIARHRARRTRDIRQRLVIATAFGLPVIALHFLARFLSEDPRHDWWPLALQLLLTAWVMFAAGWGWIFHGIRSLRFGHWRWRTSVSAALLTLLALGAADLVLRIAGGDGLVLPLAGEGAANPLRSLFAPAVMVLILWLARALLMRRRLERISEPFDAWLADLSDADQTRLRYFLKVQARHQRTGLTLGWGRLANRFTDVGLAAGGVAVVLAWLVGGTLLPAALLAAGVLLVLDPRSFQFTWVAPEVLAERRGAARGIFFANPSVFTHANVNTVVFEKTGTLTAGESAVAAIEVSPLAGLELDEDGLLRLAAAVEQGSDHSLAEGLRAEAAARGLDLPAVTDIETRTGRGLAGTVEGRRVHVGSERHLADAGIDIKPLAPVVDRLKRAGHSVILIAVDGQAAGAVGEQEQPRPAALQTVMELRDAGYAVRLITGDSESAAAHLAAEVGIGQAVVELSPEGKLEQLNRWQKAGERLAVVGRAGRHDRVLAAAEVGMALFTGDDAHERLTDALDVSDVGLGEIDEVTGCDVVLLGDTLEQVPPALRLARRVRQQRGRNLAWMLSLTAGCVLAAAVMPTIAALAEWAPAAAAALQILGLPMVLRSPPAQS